MTRIAVLAATIFSLFLSCFVNANDSVSSNPPAEVSIPLQDLRIFSEVFERIRSNYVEDIDDRTLLKYAINGMLSSLDPHSAYLQDEDFVDLQENTSGKFGGVGIEISLEDGLILVVSPIDDTPAQRAGIQAGDLIVSINGEAVLGMTVTQAVDKMRGPLGTDVVLEIRRKQNQELLTFTVQRAEISVTSVRGKILTPAIGYVRLIQFQENTGKQLAKVIQEWRDAGALDGIVLDLRNNPGGVLDAAAEVVDVFIDNGLIVYTEGRTPNSRMTYEATSHTPAAGVPLVVLINEGSASASEIVAGALQDHQRAVIVGTQSFGKGSVQSILPITDTSAIKMTTSRYYTPNGRSIQAEGIQPDIVVEQSEVSSAQRRSFKEADLPGHLQNTGNNAAKNGQSQDPSAALLKEDFQLYEAYTLLRGLTILSPKKLSKNKE